MLIKKIFVEAAYRITLELMEHEQYGEIQLDSDQIDALDEKIEGLIMGEFSKHFDAGILNAIAAERQYQDRKWGEIDEHPHSIFEWIGIMRRELSEAEEAFFQRPADPHMLREVLQVIAVGVACLEQWGVVERHDVFCPECGGLDLGDAFCKRCNYFWRRDEILGILKLTPDEDVETEKIMDILNIPKLNKDGEVNNYYVEKINRRIYKWFLQGVIGAATLVVEEPLRASWRFNGD